MRPYVRENKTDRTDVKGILEAYRNEDIRPVPLKTPVPDRGGVAPTGWRVGGGEDGAPQHHPWAVA